MENKGKKINELISIIIPVYNVDNYLKECLESVLNQIYANLEIILVDDGSTDRSGEICDEYSRKDTRIIVIHKKNGGLSDARNVGIEKAHGKYLTFIDSDDRVSESYIINLYEIIKKTKARLAMSWFEEFNEDEIINLKKTILKENKIKLVDSERCLEYMLYQNGVETSAWGKLYQADLFEKLRYPKGKIYEDIPVTYQAIVLAKKIVIIDNKDYFYLQRKDSIQYQKFNPRKMSAIEHIDYVQQCIYNEYPNLKKAVCCRKMCIACNLFFQTNISTDKQYYNLLWNIIKENRLIVISDFKARKKARIAAALSYCGEKAFKKIYQITQKRG